MAFLRVENKPSGTYLRIVDGYREDGKVKHRTLYSLGKVEDYPPDQLQRIATKLLELSGMTLEDVLPSGLKEIRRVNYGYALVIKSLFKRLKLDQWIRKINVKRRIRFDWVSALELMIAERLNEPCSKLATYWHQDEYIGLGDDTKELHHFYRTLDILYHEQESLKKHLFTAQQSLFSTKLDVVFYDVTTLYFDSQIEEADSIRQKGYSKDGKAHKTQVVLGLLVDKNRNPITYHVYKGNTYEGKTMIDALNDVMKNYEIDKVIAVADSAMIDSDNRQYMEQSESIDYIIGDRIKSLPKALSEKLIDLNKHLALSASKEVYSYTVEEYQGRKIICTYSQKRAKKDRAEREKLIAKAQRLLTNPSQLKQSKKRGAGRFIKQASEEKYIIDEDKIQEDAKWDGFKAISTTSTLSVEAVLEKYADLFEVEHAFRTLKSTLEIRPVFHWTNERIEGHIVMCFISFTMLNHLRVGTGLQYKEITRALDGMQLSEIQEGGQKERFYLRSNITENQELLIKKLKLVVPKDTTPQKSINQYFM
jgi:transposase